MRRGERRRAPRPPAGIRRAPARARPPAHPPLQGLGLLAQVQGVEPIVARQAALAGGAAGAAEASAGAGTRGGGTRPRSAHHLHGRAGDWRGARVPAAPSGCAPGAVVLLCATPGWRQAARSAGRRRGGVVGGPPGGRPPPPAALAGWVGARSTRRRPQWGWRTAGSGPPRLTCRPDGRAQGCRGTCGAQGGGARGGWAGCRSSGRKATRAAAPSSALFCCCHPPDWPVSGASSDLQSQHNSHAQAFAGRGAPWGDGRHCNRARARAAGSRRPLATLRRDVRSTARRQSPCALRACCWRAGRTQPGWRCCSSGAAS